MSTSFFNVNMNEVMKEVKMRIERMGLRFMEEGREWRLPGFLYADNLFFCDDLEEELRARGRHFVEVCGKEV